MGRKTEQHTFVTEELWNQVNKENKKLLNEFLEYCKSKDMSPATIYGYEGDIKICFVWNVQNNDNKFYIDFNKRDIMRYQNWMVNEINLSPNRVRRLKGAISSMSNFIESLMDDLYPTFRNIVNKIEAPPKNAVREKTVLEDEQIDFLLNYLVEKKKYQQACALALAVYSGARKQELLRFKVSDFADDNLKYGALYKTSEKMKTKGRGSKGKLLYRYVIAKDFKPYFDLWMEQRKELGIQGEILFWNKWQGEYKPADITTLNSWAITFSNIIDKPFYFHAGRHKFTTSLCQANIPAEVIKDIVGWESVNMVSIYNDTEIDEELGKYFSEDGIKQVETKGLGDL